MHNMEHNIIYYIVQMRLFETQLHRNCCVLFVNLQVNCKI